MRNARFHTYRTIRADLRPAKAAIDVTLGGLGKLLSTTCEGLQASEVPEAMSHAAIANIVAATSMMGKVRKRILDAHAELAVVGAHHIPELNWGDGTQSPKQGRLDEDQTDIAPAPLRSVPLVAVG